MRLEDMVKTYVITTAQGETLPNKPFMESLEQYCTHNDAELLIIPTIGSSFEETQLHQRLDPYNVITRDRRLNKRVMVSDAQVRPNQIDPITGLARFTNCDGTTIVGSPKQRLKAVPNGNKNIPQLIMTTGACTHPNYKPNRIGNIARKDHTYGAVVVEVLDGKKYNVRHLSSLKNGRFYDLGNEYTPTGVQWSQPSALILGDWHTGQTDPKIRKQTREMIKDLKPHRVVVHDFFDGYSISHHDKDRKVTRAVHHKKQGTSLEQELGALHDELIWFCTTVPESDVIFTKGNHDEFLIRYLDDGRFLNEPQNAQFSARLFADAIDGQDPLIGGLLKFGPIPDNAHFLQRDDDYKILGWQLGMHGDLGANGARAANRSLEYGAGKSITGHRHTPEMFRNVVVVGTSTRLDLDYVRGMSSWMHTHALLQPNGRPQLVHMINGGYQR